MSDQGKGGRPDRCPACGGSDLRWILYGLLDPAVFDEPGEKDWVPGGCVVGDEKWFCATCRHRW